MELQNIDQAGDRPFPYEIKWVDEDTNRDLLDKFKGEN